jgi:hypothetical protein
MNRTLLTILSVLFCAITFAQSVPQGINYQAVARDANGDVLMNQALTIQFSVISDIATSAVSWQETHQDTTNAYGLYTAIIGGGTTTNVGSSATFAVIDWGVSNHLLKVEVDYGNGLVDMGTTAFMSVPYSIYSTNPGPPGTNGIDGTNGVDGNNGVDGVDGVDGTIGFDGNSSMWKWSNNPLVLGAGKFITLTGAWGNSTTNVTQKDQITGIRIRHEDDVAVTPELEQWLLFCNVGSILYIRRVDKVQEVAYYEVTNVINYGLSTVRYLVNYIDGDGTPPAGIPDENTYINDEQYYIGYVPAMAPASSAVTYSIGDTAQGGIVFYVSPDGKNGLVAATVDQSTSSNWYKASDVISNPSNHTSEGQKFRDWRLPTKYELNIMYQQLYIQGLGGLTNLTYWTSAELNSLSAGNQDFGNGSQGSGNKDANYSNVRAVRAF